MLREQARKAVAILNRFHAMAMFEKALNEVHVSDACRLKLEDGDETPKHCRWCLLNRSESFTDKQAVELPELLRTNLKTVRAHFMREDSQRFWEYRSPMWAGKFLDDRCQRAC